MDISVDSKITVKIGDQEFVLSKEDAESLHSALSMVLNKTSYVTWCSGDTLGGNVMNCLNQSESANTAYPYDQTK